MQVALTIAGSDSGGGAGIQADLRTFQRFGVFGTSVITAVTAQNTQGVRGVHVIPTDQVLLQLAAVLEDLAPSACKSGMLATAEIATAVAGSLPAGTPYVCDPVMVATSGDRLLEPAAEAAIRERLLPKAALVTPNLDEAELLTGLEVRSPEAMQQAGEALLRLGAGAALIKGGHLAGDLLVDLLVTPEGSRRYEQKRIATTSTHGTGCTLSAAITAGLALGRPLEVAVAGGLEFVRRAIANAPGLGGGHGPLG